MSARQHFPTPRDFPPSRLRRALDALLNLVFPESCLSCSGAVVRQQDAGLCDHCWKKLLDLEITAAWCACCGLPLPGLSPDCTDLCARCATAPPSYSGARSFGYYRGELGQCVRSLKFGARKNLARHLGALMARTLVACWDRTDLDALVPVPLHPSRRRERGFNQAELLAARISMLVAIPMSPRWLARTRRTVPQVGLTDDQRRRNLQGAFSCTNSRAITGSRVLLVDDVMTTGATVESAAQSLLSAGAARVCVLTLARSVPGIE